MRRRKRNGRNEGRNTMTHLSVRIAARNIPQKKRMSVGNSKRTKNPVLPTGNQRRAPEGAQGP